MTTVNFAKKNGTVVELVTGMPQTNKAIVYRHLPSFVDPMSASRTPAMLRSEIAFGKFMISERGKYGTVTLPDGRVISVPAYEAGIALAGKSYGGLSYRERLEKRHQGAEAHIQKLERILREKTGGYSGLGREGRFEE